LIVFEHRFDQCVKANDCLGAVAGLIEKRRKTLDDLLIKSVDRL